MLTQAGRLLAGRSVVEAMSETRAVIGPVALPFGEEDAQRALDKLDAGQDPTATEWNALKVVIQLMRPAVFTNRGAFDALPSYGGRDAELTGLWETVRPGSAALGTCVGRVDDFKGDHIGTAFLVSPDLVVTNRHVLDHLSYGTGQLTPNATSVRFGGEAEAPDDDAPVGVIGCVARHERLDLVVLRLASSRAGHLTLSTEPAVDDQAVVTVGYPGRTLPPPVHAQIFAETYGVRRASPGVVRTAHADVIEHDCTTLGGSSGSPVLALPSGDVVAVHYGGQSGYANSAVPVAHLTTLLSDAGHLP